MAYKHFYFWFNEEWDYRWDDDCWFDFEVFRLKMEDDTTFCLRRNNKLKSELESTSQRDNCPRISTSKEKQEEKISLAFWMTLISLPKLSSNWRDISGGSELG